MRDQRIDLFRDNDAPPSIVRARQRVLAGLDEGIDCPCCGQLCKLYRRQINAAMAHLLLWLVAQQSSRNGQWTHASAMPLIQGRPGGGDFAKLRWWHLIEEREPNPAAGITRTSGQWRPTILGEEFARGEAHLQRYALLYDNHLAGFEGPAVDIRQCLGERFDYDALWNAYHDGGEPRCKVGHPLTGNEIAAGACWTCQGGDDGNP